MSSLKQRIHEWNQYNKNINKLNELTKQYKEKRDIIENSILDFIEQNNLKNTTIKFDNNNIFYKMNECLPPLSIKLIREILDEVLKKEDSEKILIYIKNKRKLNKKINRSLKTKEIKKERKK